MKIISKWYLNYRYYSIAVYTFCTPLLFFIFIAKPIFPIKINEYCNNVEYVADSSCAQWDLHFQRSLINANLFYGAH